jgi:phosphate:Na+ symporter
MEAIKSLNSAITDYIGRLRAEKMQVSIVDALTISVRTCRYLAEATDLADRLLTLRELADRTEFAGSKQAYSDYLDTLRALVASEEPAPELLAKTEQVYHSLKNDTLQKIVWQRLATTLGDQMLDTLSSVRRLSDQWAKSLYWRAGTDILNGYHHQEPVPENPQ